MKFMSRNMSAGEFSDFTGIPTDTLRDWRKRSIGLNLCQPHPNGNGQWLYSRESAMGVYLAQQLLPFGMTWKVAIHIGSHLASLLVSRVFFSDQPNNGGYDFRFVAFAHRDDGDNPDFQLGADMQEIFDQLSGDLKFPMVQVFDLDMIADGLPERFKDGLVSVTPGAAD